MRINTPNTLPYWDPKRPERTRQSLNAAVDKALEVGTNAAHQLVIVQLTSIVMITRGFCNAVDATNAEIAARSAREARALEQSKNRFAAVTAIAEDALARMKERTPYEFPAQ